MNEKRGGLFSFFKEQRFQRAKNKYCIVPSVINYKRLHTVNNTTNTEACI